MALTKEDGTIVEGANTYASADDVKAYALARGLSVPGDDGALEILLTKAMDYLESLRERYQGAKVSSTQALQWPREGVVIDDIAFASDEIPKELLQAQCQLAFEIQTTDPYPTTTSPAIKREKVDVIETEYAVSNGESVTPHLRKVDALLAPLFKNGGFSLRVIRI